MDIHRRVETFFAEYQDRLARALQEPPEVDAQATAAAFADCFVEASPKGVVCGQNDEAFRTVIPKGFEFYRSIGTRSMTIASLDTTPLDPLHVMARAHWVALYDRKPDGIEVRIEFDVIYFLQEREQALRIFAFVTGDEEQAFRDHGLVPD